jgi:hypothetical protein
MWTPKLQEKPSALKGEHPALQNMKILYFFYFCESFLPSWFRIRIQQLKLMRIRDPAVYTYIVCKEGGGEVPYGVLGLRQIPNTCREVNFIR